MNFGFGLRKKQKTGKLMKKYIIQRLEHKKAYKKEIDQLDFQLKNEKIDKIEQERLRGVLEAKYYEQQLEDWNKIQKKIH